MLTNGFSIEGRVTDATNVRAALRRTIEVMKQCFDALGKREVYFGENGKFLTMLSSIWRKLHKINYELAMHFDNPSMAKACKDQYYRNLVCIGYLRECVARYKDVRKGKRELGVDVFYQQVETNGESRNLSFYKHVMEEVYTDPYLCRTSKCWAVNRLYSKEYNTPLIDHIAVTKEDYARVMASIEKKVNPGHLFKYHEKSTHEHELESDHWSSLKKLYLKLRRMHICNKAESPDMSTDGYYQTFYPRLPEEARMFIDYRKSNKVDVDRFSHMLNALQNYIQVKRRQEYLSKLGCIIKDFPGRGPGKGEFAIIVPRDEETFRDRAGSDLLAYPMSFKQLIRLYMELQKPKEIFPPKIILRPNNVEIRLSRPHQKGYDKVNVEMLVTVPKMSFDDSITVTVKRTTKKPVLKVSEKQQPVAFYSCTAEESCAGECGERPYFEFQEEENKLPEYGFKRFRCARHFQGFQGQVMLP